MQLNRLDCSVDDTTVIHMIPVWVIRPRAELNDPRGSLPELSVSLFVSYLFMFLLPCIFKFCEDQLNAWIREL